MIDTEGKIVKTVKDGNTTYIYHDDYCRNKSPAEVEAILDRIARIALPGIREAYAKGKEDVNSA